MLFTRKIGKILRGNATPSQVILACMLGGALGFVPGFFLAGDVGGGFSQSPALILGLLFLVLILNANLAIFGIATLTAKLLSYLLLPVSFSIGRFLLEGPTKGLFEWMVSQPVLAWCGFEYYATSGGLLLGLVYGLVLGVLVWKGLVLFRKRMAGLEVDSERYRKLAGKRSVRVASWVFLGGKSKQSYQELLEKRRASPVRIVGVIAVVVLVAGSWLLQSFLAGSFLRTNAQAALQSWNGATVDLPKLALDLSGGRIEIGGLALANRTELEQNRFSAGSLNLKLDTARMLAKQFVVAEITASAAATGQQRETPGIRFPRPDDPVEPPPGEGKTLEDYLKQAEVWKARLEEVKDWLEVLIRGDEAPPETDDERERRIEEEARVLGYSGVVAGHLVRQHPTVLIRALNLEGVVSAELAGDLLDIRGRHLSSHPSRVDEPMELSIQSRSGVLKFVVRYDAQAGGLTTDFAFAGLSVDKIANELKIAPVAGGTMDVALKGTLSSGAKGLSIDLPLQVTLHKTTLTIPGLTPTAVDRFELPLGLRGPLTAPRITVDDSKLVDALVAAGRAELAREVRGRADALLKGVPGVGEGLGGLIEGTKTPEQLLQEARKQAEEEARKRAEEEIKKQTEEALKKHLPGGLGGLLPGRKKEGEK